MKKFSILIITAPRMCVSTMLQCMHLCIYIVHVQGVVQKYFWTWNKIAHCSAIYIDSKFTIQDFISSKSD